MTRIVRAHCRRVISFFFAVLSLMAGVSLTAADTPAPLPGAWDGEAILAGNAVRIRCEFKADSRTPGAVTGDFYTRQSTTPTPLENIVVSGDQIAFVAKADNQAIRFEGRRAGRAIDGAFAFVNTPAIKGRFNLALPPAAAAAGGKTPVPPAPTSLAGEWEGRIRLNAADPAAEGTPLRLRLENAAGSWRGSLYIKSREFGHVLESVTVIGDRFSAETTVENQRLSLRGVRQAAGLQGDFSVRDGKGATQAGVWTATPATGSIFEPSAPDPILPHENPAQPRALARETGLPVFPGAEGFGSRTPAGRGGRVIEVTHLDDSGAGSLRDALAQKGPRTIVFRVGGVIRLKELLFVNEPFVTVAGQTAPGDGICLADAGIVVTTHDVLLQHLRIRPGNRGPVTPAHNDAVCILGDRNKPDGGAHHIVLDHLSLSWSEDECLSVWGGAHDITIANCLIGEALSRARHDKNTHSAGLLVGDSSEHVSMHHNLLAHNSFRNPLIAKGGTHEFVNNVVYDWQDGPCEIYDLKSNTFLNFTGNTYRKGPNTTNPARAVTVIAGADKGTPKLWLDGNIDPHHAEPTDNPWLSVGSDWKGAPAGEKLRALKPFVTRGLTRQSASAAYAQVLAQAGATLPRRDAVDRRLVDEVKRQTGKIIDSPDEVGGLPDYATGTAPADQDHDGMPDAWEIARKLNPNNPADGAQDADRDGYTNLEAFLHSLR